MPNNWRVSLEAASGKWALYPPGENTQPVARFDGSFEADFCAMKIERAVARIVNEAIDFDRRNVKR